MNVAGSFLRRAGTHLVLIAAGLAALALGFLPARELRVQWWIEFGPLLVRLGLLLIPVLIWAGLRPLRRGESTPGTERARELIAVLILVLLTALLLRQVPPSFRIQADESLQVGTSFGLYLTGSPLVPSSGYYDTSGALHASNFSVDKRGLLFPVMLDALHRAFGYSPRHGFLLNAVLTLLIPLLCYAGLRPRVERTYALAGALAVLLHPVLIWCGTASGFEPANLVFGLGAWVALVHAERARIPALWLLGALLGALAAQARYESSLFGAVAFLLAWRGLARGGAPRWFAALVPVMLLYLPFAWQRGAKFEFGMGELDPGAEIFSMGMVLENLGHAARLLLVPGAFEPVGAVLVALAAVAVIPGNPPTASVQVPPRSATSMVLGGAVLALMLPVFALAWGNLEDPVTLRLGLPLMVLLSLAAALGLARLGSWLRLPAWSAPALAAALLACTIPSVRSPYRDGGQLVALAQNAVNTWLHHDAPRCRPALLFQFPTAFVVEGTSAFSGRDPNALWPTLRRLSERGDIDGAWWLELRDSSRGIPFPRMAAPTGFDLTVLGELPLKKDIGVRIIALDRRDAPLARSCRPESTRGAAPAGNAAPLGAQ